MGSTAQGHRHQREGDRLRLVCVCLGCPAITDALDAAIDRYLAAENRDRPRIGYPTRACGTALARPSRQYQSEHETNAESSTYAELVAAEGAWDSLEREHDVALRVDAINRELRRTVMRVPDTSAARTAELVAEAKAIFRRLMADRGFTF